MRGSGYSNYYNYARLTPSVTVILSASKPDKTFAENAHNFREMIGRLHVAGITFEPVKGCYKGRTEDSVVTKRVFGTDLEVLRNLLIRYEQESALVLMPYETGDNAPLAFICPSADLSPSVVRAFAQQTTRHEWYIGRFNLVSKDEALRSEAYTEKDDKYFVWIKEPWEMDENPEFVG